MCLFDATRRRPGHSGGEGDDARTEAEAVGVGTTTATPFFLRELSLGIKEKRGVRGASERVLGRVRRRYTQRESFQTQTDKVTEVKAARKLVWRKGLMPRTTLRLGYTWLLLVEV